MLGELSIHFGQTFLLRLATRQVLRRTSRFDSVSLNVFGYFVPPGVESGQGHTLVHQWKLTNGGESALIAATK